MAKSKPAVPQRHFAGAHMSIAGGMPRSVERAAQVGCTALQVFVKNSNRWEGPPIADAEAKSFRAALPANGIRPEHVFAHTSYLINLASPDEELGAKSVAALVDELRRCHQLGIPGLVMHPGSPGKGADRAEAIARIGRRAAAALREAGGDTRLLYECTAGTGAHLGATWEDLGELLAATATDRAGVCLDTCHMFAAGLDIRTPDAWMATFARFEELVGFKNLHAMHVNDSEPGFGSRKDRHAHIGAGQMGELPFRMLMHDARFDAVPMSLETEKDDSLEDDRRNLATLARLEAEASPFG